MKSSHQDMPLLDNALGGDSFAVNNLLSHLDANLNNTANVVYQRLVNVVKDNSNHSQALTLLGILNYFGYGIKKNRDEAFSCFKKAVSFNNPEAMTWQAMMLENGEACTVNIEQAVQLYQTAANLNNPRALYVLANLHTYGRCKFEINYTKAIDYLKRAIKLKSPDAMNNMAYMLMEGLGRQRNYHKAEKLLLAAIEEGHHGAILNLMYLYKFNLTDQDRSDDINKLQLLFKTKLNQLPEAKLGGFTSVIARTDLFYLLPEPSETDKEYTKYYHTVKAIHDQILLAHRFEIFGNSEVNGVEFYLNGSYPEVMLNELIISFRQYVDTQLQSLMSELQNSEKVRFSDQAINELLDHVVNDLDASLTQIQARKFTHESNLIALIPRFQRSGNSMFHVFSLTLFNDFFMISDKANYKDRVALYRVSESDSDLANAIKNNIAEMIIANGANVSARDNPVTNNSLVSQLFGQSNLYGKKIKEMPAKRQHADICTWLSAKYSLFSVIYFRFYEALTAAGLGEQEAHSLCYQYAQKIYKHWSAYDRQQSLKSYLAGHQPDPILLAYICQKYQYRSEKAGFITSIMDSKLVDEKHFAEAKVLANKLIRRLFRDELSVASPNLKYFYTDADVNTLSDKLTELYLLGGKSALEEIFPKIFDFTIFPVKRAILLINEVITKETQIKKSSYEPRLYSAQDSPNQQDTKQDLSAKRKY